MVQSSFLSNGSKRGSGGAIAVGNSGYTSTITNITIPGAAVVRSGVGIARLSNKDLLSLVHVTVVGGAAVGVDVGAIYNVSNSGGTTAQNSILGESAAAFGFGNVGDNRRGAGTNSGAILQFGSENACGMPTIAFGDPLLGAVRAADSPTTGLG